MKFCIHIKDAPPVLQRGLRIAAGRRGVLMRDFILTSVVDAVNAELAEMDTGWWKPLASERTVKRRGRPPKAEKAE